MTTYMSNLPVDGSASRFPYFHSLSVKKVEVKRENVFFKGQFLGLWFPLLYSLIVEKWKIRTVERQIKDGTILVSVFLKTEKT